MSESKTPRFPCHIDRNHLPEPDWEFPNAKIETYAVNSNPDFPPIKEAPKGAPNILLVLLDDPHHRALLPDACGVADRTEPSFSRQWHDPGTGDGLPGVLRDHPERLRDIRRAAEAVGLHLRVVRQEPQRAG
jgi:hypothetical protein